MRILLAILALALVLFVLGFIVKLLWIAAAVLIALWLIGFATRRR